MSRAADLQSNGFRTFVTLWASQAVSVLGSALSAFAFNIYLAQTVFPLESQKPQLALALSVTALAFTLTAMLGAPLAGVWADRHDRRKTMLGCDLLSAGLALTTGLLMLYLRPSFWALLPLVALRVWWAAFTSAPLIPVTPRWSAKRSCHAPTA